MLFHHHCYTKKGKSFFFVIALMIESHSEKLVVLSTILILFMANSFKKNNKEFVYIKFFMQTDEPGKFSLFSLDILQCQTEPYF